MSAAGHRARRRALVAAFLATAAGASRRVAAQVVGPDLDTPFVTTPENVVRTMLELARLAPGERLVDLGSGDGRIVLEAARRGAIAHGVEIDPRLVARSRAAAAQEGLAGRATFATEDLFETDFGAADVVTMYLLPDVNARLAPKLYATLRPGARIVSHDYGLGEWPADETVEIDAPGKSVGLAKRSKVMRWTVPAQFAGRWSGRASGEPLALDLRQRWQQVDGVLRRGGQAIALGPSAADGREVELRADAGAAAPVRVRLAAGGDGALLGILDAGSARHEIALRLLRPG